MNNSLELWNANNSVPKLQPHLGSGAALNGHLANMTSDGFALHRPYPFLADHGFPAYSANLTAEALQEVLDHLDVLYVEQNALATTYGDAPPAGQPKCDAQQVRLSPRRVNPCSHLLAVLPSVFPADQPVQLGHQPHQRAGELVWLVEPVAGPVQHVPCIQVATQQYNNNNNTHDNRQPQPPKYTASY